MGQRPRQPVAHQRIGADHPSGQLRKAAVPDLRLHLLAPHPAFEPVAVLRPIQKKPPAARKPHAVIPRHRLPTVHLGDEIFEVAFPAAVVIALKDQLLTPFGAIPARIMDGGEIGDKAGAEPQDLHILDDVERQRRGQPPQQAGLQGTDRGDVVLRIAGQILHRLHGGDVIMGRIAVIRRLARLDPP